MNKEQAARRAFELEEELCGEPSCKQCHERIVAALIDAHDGALDEAERAVLHCLQGWNGTDETLAAIRARKIGT